MQVLVVGAGIVGLASAIWLQRAGHAVTLIDRAVPGSQTSHGNAGVLAASSRIPVTVPGLARQAPRMLFDPRQPLFLRWSYLPRLLPFLRRYLAHATPAHLRHYAESMGHLLGDTVSQHMALAEGTEAAQYVQQNDYVFGYASDAARGRDKAYWDLRRALGVRFEDMTGADYARIDPLMGPRFDRVVVCKDHGMISDPGAYLRALYDHFRAEGGQFIHTALRDLIRDGDRITGVTTDQGAVSGDAVVLAMGPWSGDVARGLGLRRLSFESERGYHIEWETPSDAPVNPVMVAAGKFVLTPMRGRIRAAGVVEFGGLKAGASRAPLRLLRRQMRALLPEVTYAREVTWMGHRPAPSDSLPLIGPVGQGAYLAFGHQHVGLTGGAKTGRVVAQMIDGTPPNMNLAPFDPRRYA